MLSGFIAAAEGFPVTDVDGRSYIHCLCANGPNLLGYRHPEVEAAVTSQRERLVSGSLFPPSLVELVEALGNGYSGSAQLGTETFRDAAREILYTSTYLFESPPMRAALKVLELYDRGQVFWHLTAMGERNSRPVRTVIVRC